MDMAAFPSAYVPRGIPAPSAAAASSPLLPASMPALMPALGPPVTHDVTLVTTRKLAQARVLGVPPEEFGIERGARSIADCNYCFHEVVTRTESQLIAEGFDAEQDRSLGDYTGKTGIETLARDTVGEHFGITAGGVNSAARLVRITEHYVRMDYEGEGRSSLYQVITGGDQGEDPAQGRPRMHHAVRCHPVCGDNAGSDDAPLLRPLDRRSCDAGAAGEDRAQARRTGQSLSAQQSAGRSRREHGGPEHARRSPGVAPGGVVRTRQPGGLNWQAVPDITTSIYPMLQYLDAELETRTGVASKPRVSTPMRCRTSRRRRWRRCSRPRRCGSS